jgi:hypothetical protein
MRRLVSGTTIAAVLAAASSAGAELAPPSPAPPPVKRTCAAYEVVKHEGGAPTARCVKYQWTGPPSTRSGVEPLSGTERISPKLLTPGQPSGTVGSHRAAHHVKRASANAHAPHGATGRANSTGGTPAKGGSASTASATVPGSKSPANKVAAAPKSSGSGITVAVIVTIIVASVLAALALAALVRRRGGRWRPRSAS